MPGDNRYHTPKSAAEFLHVPVSTLAKWRCYRQGPRYSRLHAKSIIYAQKDLEAFIASMAVETEDSLRINPHFQEEMHESKD